MRTIGHKDLTTRKCGFIVHPTKGWIGASPDSFVTDPSVLLQNGIVEFKCPFSKKDLSPTEACQFDDFCCTLTENKLCLKHHHQYYHQVQLQLFVGMDMYSWCDFCVYTLTLSRPINFFLILILHYSTYTLHTHTFG